MDKVEPQLHGRILIVDGKAVSGGGQRMLPLMAQALTDNEPIIVRPCASTEQIAGVGIRVERVDFPSYPLGLRRWLPMLRMLPRVLVTAWRLRRCIQRHHIKIVIANDLYSVIPLLPAVAGLGIPIIFYAHSCDLPAAASRLLQQCAGVIACSQAAAEALPASPTRVRVVHNAVDISAVLAETVRTRSASSWVVGYAGRIDANKNLAALIQAFAQVRETLDGAGCPARLEILGSGDEAVVRELKTLADQLGLTAVVAWRPWAEHPHAVIAEWDAVVLVSHLESFGLCLVEGQMLGKLVMGTRVGGIPEIISDDLTGILAESPASADLATALMRLRHASAEIAVAGRRQAYQRFSPPVYGQRLRQALREILAYGHV